tara:strand:+ start:412 stop:1815 length:1404 start_codon:yes stop_codon:yes gene_type:complete
VKYINQTNTKVLEIKKVSKDFEAIKSKKELIKRIIKYNNEIKKINILSEITFDVYKGEIVGIIGKNGSGKSTLLQLICGTLAESEGKIIRNGKIAALLELGSGFNPEFTGKENIYLNGMILGLTKKQVEDRFEDIKKFAEIGEYIDRPIKTYSSGMIVRLAFAVITNVDADTLVIDEALAVGDAYFNQKCMRFINKFKMNGGSIIFVSHDANAIMGICDRAILLKDGKIDYLGEPKKAIEKYDKQMHIDSATKTVGTQKMERDNKEGKPINSHKYGEDERYYKERWQDYRQEAIKKSKYINQIQICRTSLGDDNIESYGNKKIVVSEVEIFDKERHKKVRNIIGGEVVELKIEARCREDINNIIMGFLIKNDRGQILLGDNTLNSIYGHELVSIKRGDRLYSSFIFTLPLLPKGDYSISVSIASGTQDSHEILNWINDAIILKSRCSIVSAGYAGVPMHSIIMRVIK